MTEYIRTPGVVEAVQMTVEMIDRQFPEPKWLREAWERGRGQDGGLFLLGLPAYREPTAILSPRAGVTIRINPGDWIVKEESGLVAHTAEVFERVYEAA